MPNTMIDNHEILKDASHEKKILSALKRIDKASKEITELGYSIYVTANGGFNVMNTDDVSYNENLDYHADQLVASTQIGHLDCGDW